MPRVRTRRTGRKRLRERFSAEKNVSGTVTVYLGESGVTYPLANCNLAAGYEYMLDTFQKKKEGLKAFFNPCFHDKTTVVAKPLELLEVWNTETAAVHTWEFSSQNAIQPRNLWDALRVMPNGITDQAVSDFCVRAEHHFKTAVDVEVLSYNLMLDVDRTLVQFTRKLKDIRQQTNVFNGFSEEQRKKLYRRYIGRGAREFFSSPNRAIKKSSDGWLLYNFAVKPFISDLKKLASAQKKVSKRIAFLRKFNGHLIEVDYREGPRARADTQVFAGSVAFPLMNPGFEYLKPSDTTMEIDYEVESQLIAHALVKFDIDTALLYSKSAHAWAMAVYLGLLAIGSTVWEGIPWSFVIDWFLDEKQKQFPKIFDYSPFKDAEIHEVYHSVKSRLIGQITFAAPSGQPGGEEQRHHIGDVVYQSYQRKHGYPLQGDPLFRVPWSGYHVSLAAALFFQRKHNR